MGGRGGVLEQARARQLRAEGWTIAATALDVGASKGSVSEWVRGVPFDPPARSITASRRRPPNALQRRKAGEIERLMEAGRARVGSLSERDLLSAGTALYAGEGSKRDGDLCFADSSPAMIGLFCAWLRRFFPVDESRLRVRLCLHEGLDLDAAVAFWSGITGVPPTQFRRAYRAPADPSIRRTRHPMGVASVVSSSSNTHRSVMGLGTRC